MQPTAYYLRIHRNNVMIDLVDNFTSVSYTKRVNKPGYMTAAFANTSNVFNTLQLDDDVTVVREFRPLMTAGFSHYDFFGYFRGTSQSFDGQRGEKKNIHCPDLHYLLQKTIIAYKAGQNDVASWTNKQIDQIVREIINYNFTTNAGTQPAYHAIRLVPVTTKVIVASITALGSTISYAAAYRSVMEAISELIEIDGLDMLLQRVLSQVSIQLRTLYGTDRTATVHFSLDRGNMIAPSFDKRQELNPTQALVGGQGEGVARMTELRTSAEYVNPTNHYEMFVDARNLDNSAALQAIGDSRLASGAYKPNLTFRVVQTPGCLYGKHYFLGDKITAIYGDETLVQKIVGVSVNATPYEEKIELELENA